MDTELIASYVEDRIKLIEEHTVLRASDTIDTQEVNKALLDYGFVIRSLRRDYQKAKLNLIVEQRGYDQWQDGKFVEVRQELTEGKPPSFKIAVKEIEAEMSVKFKDEIYDKKEKLIILEYQIEYLENLIKDFNNTHENLRSVSSNIRKEMDMDKMAS